MFASASHRSTASDTPPILASARASRAIHRYAADQTERDRRRSYLLMLLTGKQEAQEVRAFELGAFLRGQQTALYDERIADLRDIEALRRAFASVRLPGRLEVVRRTDAASVLLDGARDAAGAAALATALTSEFAVRNRIGVAGLVGGLGVGRARRSPLRAPALLWTVTAGILALLPAVYEFSWRYMLPALVMMPVAGALGVTALTDRTRPMTATAGQPSQTTDGAVAPTTRSAPGSSEPRPRSPPGRAAVREATALAWHVRGALFCASPGKAICSVPMRSVSRLIARTAVAALLCAALPAAGWAGNGANSTAYKWVDAHGVIHYSDHPHPDAKKLHITGAQTYSAPPIPPRRACALAPASDPS